MSEISVRRAGATEDLGAAWSALVRRASANVFMDPAAIAAVGATGFADTLLLTAWERDTLVGVWALRTARLTPFGPAVLTAPPYDYAFVSSPVVEDTKRDAAVAAFLDAIATDPALPKVVRLRYLDGGDASYPALTRALGERGAETLVLSTRERAYASREAGVKKSGSTRKKLRQDWNRLSADGALAYVNDRRPDAVRAAFETFLTLEAASWKGGNGTALLSRDGDAAFARRLIANLADTGGASVALLTLDGRPIAAQVLLYSGTVAYTWKTAFDAAHGKHSPGAVLVDKVAEELFTGDTIDAIESCSPDGSFMSQLWSGRRATVDLLVDLGGRRSATFTALAIGVHGYAALKHGRNRLRALAASWRPGGGRIAPARS